MSIVCTTMGKSVAPYASCPHTVKSEILKTSFVQIARAIFISEYCLKGIRLESRNFLVIKYLPHLLPLCACL